MEKMEKYSNSMMTPTINRDTLLLIKTNQINIQHKHKQNHIQQLVDRVTILKVVLETKSLIHQVAKVKVKIIHIIKLLPLLPIMDKIDHQVTDRVDHQDMVKEELLVI